MSAAPAAPTTYDVLDETLLAMMLEAADPHMGRFENVISVNLTAVLVIVKALLEGQRNGLVTRDEDEGVPF